MMMLLVAGCWLLVVGCWFGVILLVTGCWLLVWRDFARVVKGVILLEF